MPLTPEQQAKIEANRARALERLQARGILAANSSKVSKPPTIPTTSRSTIHSINLTEDQRRKIEANRQKALEKLKEKQDQFRNASNNTNTALANTIRPSVRKDEYIDYDLSTMKDTKGGFIDMAGNSMGQASEEKTFEEWRAEQRVVRDLPPPADIANATKCFECGTVEIDPQLWDVFKCRVCRRCSKSKPQKYALLTKTECKEDYFMTEPELKDSAILPHLEKPNPHGHSRMQLFLRYQIEEFAFKKWGGAEGLDNEWVRREEGRVKRREKRMEEGMKEMRKRVRAEEYNRRRVKDRGDDHAHEWSGYFDGGKDEDGLDLKRRRCLHCGFETEEIVI